MSRILRRWHRWLSVIIALPLAVVVVSGLVLQWRGKVEWIQPATVRAQKLPVPLLTPEEVQRKVSGDIDQIIYRPAKNALAVRLATGEEVQLHPQTGAVLKRGPRRTNWLIELHQGSLFGAWAQYGLYVFTAWGLLFLLGSGLFIFPWKRSRP